MRQEWATGAPHASELPYLFDTLDARYPEPQSLTSNDRAMSRAFRSYIANFAKHGNPNTDDLPSWSQFNPDRFELMDFGLEGPEMKQDPFRARVELVARAVGGRGSSDPKSTGAIER
jgi:para-nitrobenzyl esterase